MSSVHNVLIESAQVMDAMIDELPTFTDVARPINFIVTSFL